MMKRTFPLTSLLLPLILVGCQGTVEGQWQGTTAQKAVISSKRTPEFLVMDSGGSGGSFGKGDSRCSLHDVASIDGNTVWTCGYGGVFRSDDGGFTWDKILPGGSWHFIGIGSTPSDIWLVEGAHPGGPGKVWLRHSPDGGLIWQEAAPGKFSGYSDFLCKEKELWLLQGTYGAMRSDDGGANWRQVDFKQPSFQPYKVSIPADIKGTDGFTVYVLGATRINNVEERVLLKSEDSGRSWRKVALPQARKFASWRQAMFFATSQQGWVGAEDGSIFMTEDGGATWNCFQLPGELPVKAIHVDQLGHGFASVYNGDIIHPGPALYYSSDSGRSWTLAASGAKQINKFARLGPGGLIAVGDVPGFVRNDLVMLQKQ